MNELNPRIPVPPMEPIKPKKSNNKIMKPVGVSFGYPYTYASKKNKEIEIEIEMKDILNAYNKLKEIIDDDDINFSKVRLVLRDDTCWYEDNPEPEFFLSQEVMSYMECENENYDKALDEYNKEMALYDSRMVVYNIKKEEYEKELEKYMSIRDSVKIYNKKIKEYEEEISKLRKDLNL